MAKAANSSKPGSIVLDEKHDPNYEPTQQEIDEYAEWLGMSLPEDTDLLYIARDGLKASLPPDWKLCQTKGTGDVYYFNFKTGESIWDHPMDAHFKDIYKKKKAEKAAREVVPDPRPPGPQGTSMARKGSGQGPKVLPVKPSQENASVRVGLKNLKSLKVKESQPVLTPRNVNEMEGEGQKEKKHSKDEAEKLRRKQRQHQDALRKLQSEAEQIEEDLRASLKKASADAEAKIEALKREKAEELEEARKELEARLQRERSEMEQSMRSKLSEDLERAEQELRSEQAALLEEEVARLEAERKERLEALLTEEESLAKRERELASRGSELDRFEEEVDSAVARAAVVTEDTIAAFHRSHEEHVNLARESFSVSGLGQYVAGVAVALDEWVGPLLEAVAAERASRISLVLSEINELREQTCAALEEGRALRAQGQAVRLQAARELEEAEGREQQLHRTYREKERVLEDAISDMERELKQAREEHNERLFALQHEQRQSLADLSRRFEREEQQMADELEQKKKAYGARLQTLYEDWVAERDREHSRRKGALDGASHTHRDMESALDHLSWEKAKDDLVGHALSPAKRNAPLSPSMAQELLRMLDTLKRKESHPSRRSRSSSRSRSRSTSPVVVLPGLEEWKGEGVDQEVRSLRAAQDRLKAQRRELKRKKKELKSAKESWREDQEYYTRNPSPDLLSVLQTVHAVLEHKRDEVQYDELLLQQAEAWVQTKAAKLQHLSRGSRSALLASDDLDATATPRTAEAGLGPNGYLGPRLSHRPWKPCPRGVGDADVLTSLEQHLQKVARTRSRSPPLSPPRKHDLLHTLFPAKTASHVEKRWSAFLDEARDHGMVA